MITDVDDSWFSSSSCAISTDNVNRNVSFTFTIFFCFHSAPSQAGSSPSVHWVFPPFWCIIVVLLLFPSVFPWIMILIVVWTSYIMVIIRPVFSKRRLPCYGSPQAQLGWRSHQYVYITPLTVDITCSQVNLKRKLKSLKCQYRKVGYFVPSWEKTIRDKLVSNKRIWKKNVGTKLYKIFLHYSSHSITTIA